MFFKISEQYVYTNYMMPLRSYSFLFSQISCGPGILLGCREGRRGLTSPNAIPQLGLAGGG